MNDFGDKNIATAIKSRLNIFKLLDNKQMYDLVNDTIESFKVKEDLIEYLINPVPFYTAPMQEPSGLVLNKVCDSERIILTEHMYMPFKAKVMIDGVEHPVRTRKKLTMYPSYTRKNQQISNKEAKSATSANTTNILGQAAGSDKVGTFSDAEWTVCLQHNLYNITKELNGPASHDMEAKKVYRNTMMNLGEVSLKELPDNVESKRSVVYLDHMLKMMGIDTDLLQYPE